MSINFVSYIVLSQTNNYQDCICLLEGWHSNACNQHLLNGIYSNNPFFPKYLTEYFCSKLLQWLGSQKLKYLGRLFLCLTASFLINILNESFVSTYIIDVINFCKTNVSFTLIIRPLMCNFSREFIIYVYEINIYIYIYLKFTFICYWVRSEVMEIIMHCIILSCKRPYFSCICSKSVICYIKFNVYCIFKVKYDIKIQNT